MRTPVSAARVDDRRTFDCLYKGLGFKWSRSVASFEELGVRDLRAATDDELLCWTPRHPRAFDEFYVRHEAVVLVYFRRRTDSSDVALDLAAETFVRALAGVRRYKPGREPAIAWVLGIARHVLIDSLRRGRVADRARARMGAPVLALDDEELERIDALGRRSAESLLANLPVE